MTSDPPQLILLAEVDCVDSPYHLLAPRTLIELVIPGDWATWRRLRKLYVDVGLYSLDQDIEKLENIGLWLVASRMSEGFLDLARRELGSLDHTEPGIYRGSSHGVNADLKFPHIVN